MCQEELEEARQLSFLMCEQNRKLAETVEGINGYLAEAQAERDRLLEDQASMLQGRSEEARSLVAEFEAKQKKSDGIADSLRQELSHLNHNSEVYQAQAKVAKEQLALRSAELSDCVARYQRELDEVETSKSKAVSDQRHLIDQLSNSMSEAATQLIQTQNVDRDLRAEIETKGKRIFNLEHEISSLRDRLTEAQDSVVDLTADLTDACGKLKARVAERDQLAERRVQLEEELVLKNLEISNLEKNATQAESMQKKLISELEALPVINKRLEADCVFLREDSKACAERIKKLVVENEALAKRVKMTDSLLSPEQRAKLASQGGGASLVDASAVLENRKLLIETMELRMRLVDSQAARDKAQSQVLSQSEIILKLQKQQLEERRRGVQRVTDENVCLTTSNYSPKSVKKSNKTTAEILKEEEPDCKQQ